MKRSEINLNITTTTFFKEWCHYRISNIFVAFMLISILSGCASTQQFVPMPEPSQVDNSTVYIELIRSDSIFASATALQIEDNRRIIGYIGHGGSLVWERKEGDMTLQARFTSEGSSVLLMGSIAIPIANFPPLNISTQGGHKYQIKVSHPNIFSSKVFSLETCTEIPIPNNKKISIAKTEKPSEVKMEQAYSRNDLNISISNLNLPGAYYALVIGNDDYQSLPKLSTAVNDADDVAKTLGEDYGFKVTLLKNATRTQTLKALYEFRKLGKDDRLLIYYAGHGWLDTKADEGYWLPVDASRDDNVDWIQNATITAEARACNAKQILIVADSCYSGKLVRGIQVVGKTTDNSETFSDKKARLVMSSGGLEPVADASGKGNHSVFASAFLDTLKSNSSAIDGLSFYTKVRQKVGWNADQIPEYGVIHKSGHDGGDFIFIRKNTN